MQGDQPVADYPAALASATAPSDFAATATSAQGAADPSADMYEVLRARYRDLSPAEMFTDLLKPGAEQQSQMDFIHALLNGDNKIEESLSAYDRSRIIENIADQRIFGSGGLEGYVCDWTVDLPVGSALTLGQIKDVRNSKTGALSNISEGERENIGRIIENKFPLSRLANMQKINIKSNDYYELHIGAKAAIDAGWDLVSMSEASIRATGQAVVVLGLTDKEMINWVAGAIEFPAKLEFVTKNKLKQSYAITPNAVISRFMEKILDAQDINDPVKDAENALNSFRNYESFADAALQEEIRNGECAPNSEKKWARGGQTCKRPGFSEQDRVVVDLSIDARAQFRAQNEELVKKLAITDTIMWDYFFSNAPDFYRKLMEEAAIEMLAIGNAEEPAVAEFMSRHDLVLLYLTVGGKNYLFEIFATSRGYEIKNANEMILRGRNVRIDNQYHTVKITGDPISVRVKLKLTGVKCRADDQPHVLSEAISEYRRDNFLKKLNAMGPDDPGSVWQAIKTWLPFYGCTSEGSRELLGATMCAADVTLIALKPLVDAVVLVARVGQIGMILARKQIAEISKHGIWSNVVRQTGFRFLYHAKVGSQMFMTRATAGAAMEKFSKAKYSATSHQISEKALPWSNLYNFAKKLTNKFEVGTSRIAQYGFTPRKVSIDDLRKKVDEITKGYGAAVEMPIFITAYSKSTVDSVAVTVPGDIRFIVNKGSTTDRFDFAIDVDGELYRFTPTADDLSSGWIDGVESGGVRYAVAQRAGRYEFAALNRDPVKIPADSANYDRLQDYLDLWTRPHGASVKTDVVLDAKKGLWFISDESEAHDLPSRVHAAVQINNKFYNFTYLKNDGSKGLISSVNSASLMTFNDPLAFVQWNGKTYELMRGADLVKVRNSILTEEIIYPHRQFFGKILDENVVTWDESTKKNWLRLGGESVPVRKVSESPETFEIYDLAKGEGKVLVRRDMYSNEWIVDPDWIEKQYRTDWLDVPRSIERLDVSKELSIGGLRSARTEDVLRLDLHRAKKNLLETKSELRSIFDSNVEGDQVLLDVCCRLFLGGTCDTARIKEIKDILLKDYANLEILDIDKNIIIRKGSNDPALGRVVPKKAGNLGGLEYIQNKADLLYQELGEDEYIHALSASLLKQASRLAEQRESEDAALNYVNLSSSAQRNTRISATSAYVNEWATIDLSRLVLLGRQYSVGAVRDPILSAEVRA
ncbi:hypothetical protein D7S86_16065 [Pararobbsia silviterrae]|uniref:Uncharacterized protein n=2 Tax=Pararobbsia silviterrae TaxID=1792498 RepID=A0A494XU94_9BURK|nr:hypothetical protein D7S86_16065 [Pararobbsia silviterrae]